MKKIPFWCAHCKKVIEKIDYKFIEKYGVCGDCFINYIENRLEDKSEKEIFNYLQKKESKNTQE